MPRCSTLLYSGSDGGRSGTIAYPLSGLLRVVTLSGCGCGIHSNNMAESTVSFRVVKGLAPDIVELYTDANPAVDMVKFYIRHNRPDAMLQVKLTVYDLSGRIVWSTHARTGAATCLSQLLSFGIYRITAADAFPNGLYIYKVAISADGGSETSATRSSPSLPVDIA